MKPKRHVVHVADLTAAEAAEMGIVLYETARVVSGLTAAEQVYVTLWSHMHAVPGHIHFVVQPVTQATMDEHDGKHGARLQVEMFDRRVYPDSREAARFAARATPGRGERPSSLPSRPVHGLPQAAAHRL